MPKCTIVINPHMIIETYKLDAFLKKNSENVSKEARTLRERKINLSAKHLMKTKLKGRLM